MSSTFNVFDHVEKLEPAKEKGRYVCPACQSGNLTIAENGAYQCWNGCECRQIREAIAPWTEQSQAAVPQRNYGGGRPTKQPNPAPLPDTIDLAKLPPATDCPQPQKRFDKDHGEIEEWVYDYGADKWKTRTQWTDSSKAKGHDKTFLLWHRDDSGKTIPKSGEGVRPPYRIDEAITAAKASGANAVMCAEGEKAVEIYRSIGLACITLSSFSKDELALMAQLLKDAKLTLVYHRDHDEAGLKKAAKVQQVCDRAGVPCLIISPFAICPDLPESGDIVEMLAMMEVPEFIKRLEEEIHRKAQHSSELLDEIETPDSFDPDVAFTQKARRDLYGDKHWICVNDVLHYWTGNHYKVSLDAVEAQRLWRYCNGYAVADDKGNISYPYATPVAVKKALEWVKIGYGIDPALINPPGLNCTNGVLQLSWVGSTPSWRLEAHDPSLYYTFDPVVPYDPEADPTNCDRLLDVLDADQQQVFLRTVAASLDLTTVRKHKGRLVGCQL